MIQPDELRDLALDVALRAGRLLTDERPVNLGVATKSSPTDVVTEMDRAAERLLVDALRSKRPDDGFLGEEGAAEQSRSGVRWVLDPIDGTVNYLYGSPLWAVSVAAELDGGTVAGVVHVPALGETFAAAVGGGATLNGRPISAAPAVDLDQALVATGFDYDSCVREQQAQILAGLLGRVRDLRRSGSAAIDTCWVACGRLDGYYEREVNRWDVAAAGLIAAEAGAEVHGQAALIAEPTLTSVAQAGVSEALRKLLGRLGVDTGGPAAP